MRHFTPVGDIIQSIGVIIASVIIWIKPSWHIADPICTFLFSVLVVLTTTKIAKDCIKILMEGVPQGLDLKAFETGLESVKGVVDIHDLHVWSISAGKPAMSAHLTSSNPSKTLKHATKYVRKFGIYHSTLQIEDIATINQDPAFACAHDIHN